ncbi:hypothetical protein Tco_0582474, partial [Tanacetum coccineum]
WVETDSVERDPCDKVSKLEVGLVFVLILVKQ